MEEAEQNIPARSEQLWWSLSKGTHRDYDLDADHTDRTTVEAD